jgi:TRAP-type C4-dicarboxylate transport system permease small subunit
MDDSHPGLSSPAFGIRRLLGALIEYLNAAGTALIVLLALLVNSDVFGRAALNHPLPGVPEFAGLAIVAIVFLQIPYCLRNKHLTRSDAFLCNLFTRSPRTAVTCDMIYSVLGSVVFVLIALAAWKLTSKAWTGNEYEGAEGVFTIPVWPVKLAVVIGAGLMAIEYLRTAWIDLKAIRTKDFSHVGSFTGLEL